jgi:nitroimidazol reductase NimA-like FMN-containing flavoprotein (pyridoxamine 5'-phosphate oxidase superfamily)
MRRKDKEMRNREAMEALLDAAAVCRLGLSPGPEDDGFPYVVPVHFAYQQGRIYIHSACQGRKMERMKKNGRVCVEVDECLGLKAAGKACGYGSRYRSVIAFGTARLVEEEAAKRRALQLLMGKYAKRRRGRESWVFSGPEVSRVAVIEIEIERMTGKRGG